MDTTLITLYLIFAIWFWGCVLTVTITAILVNRIPKTPYEWGLIAGWPFLVLAFFIDLISGRI